MLESNIDRNKYENSKKSLKFFVESSRERSSVGLLDWASFCPQSSNESTHLRLGYCYLD